MRIVLLAAIFGLIYTSLHAQGATAIPDGLDCENLTADQESYRDYCRDAAEAEAKAQQVDIESYRADIGTEEKIKDLKIRGWERLENGDYSGARTLFREAMELNELRDDSRPWLSRDYNRYVLKDLEAMTIEQEKQATAPQSAPTYSYWDGQGYVDQREREEEMRRKAVNCDSVRTIVQETETQITNISCVIGVWKRTQQSARDKSPDALNEVDYSSCPERSGFFMTNMQLRRNIDKFQREVDRMIAENRERKQKMQEARCE